MRAPADSLPPSPVWEDVVRQRVLERLLMLRATFQVLVSWKKKKGRKRVPGRQRSWHGGCLNPGFWGIYQNTVGRCLWPLGPLGCQPDARHGTATQSGSTFLSKTSVIKGKAILFLYKIKYVPLQTSEQTPLSVFKESVTLWRPRQPADL